MTTGGFKSHQEKVEAGRVVIFCPFCKYGTLESSPNGNNLSCSDCRRKVYEVRISAPRMNLLLGAFDEMYNNSDDKELSLRACHIRADVRNELDARGVAWYEDRIDPGAERLPELLIPADWAQGCKLSVTALRALNGIRHYYDFGNAPSFLDNVLHVLQRVRKLTPDQSQLRRQIQAMTPTERNSLSRAILEGQGK